MGPGEFEFGGHVGAPGGWGGRWALFHRSPTRTMKVASEFPKCRPPTGGTAGRPGVTQGSSSSFCADGPLRADAHAARPGSRRRGADLVLALGHVDLQRARPAGRSPRLVCVTPRASPPPVSNVTSCAARSGWRRSARIGPAPNRRGETRIAPVGDRGGHVDRGRRARRVGDRSRRRRRSPRARASPAGRASGAADPHRRARQTRSACNAPCVPSGRRRMTRGPCPCCWPPPTSSSSRSRPPSSSPSTPRPTASRASAAS